MRTLCEKAGVPYFRFHPLRHSGAHTLDQYQLPIRIFKNSLVTRAGSRQKSI